MRESQAPRTSRELAVRNQFFTPRYVVEFLTDNTLGRTWYEMRRGETVLIEQCQYVVRRKRPVFLGPVEDAPRRGGRRMAGRSRRGASYGPARTQTERRLGYPSVQSHHRLRLRARGTWGGGCAGHYSDVASRLRATYEQTGKWQGSFEELRIGLFF